MFKALGKLSYLAQKEEEILEFWKNRDIFKKSLKQREGSPRFTFYEGPPTTNGYPHAGHVIGRSIKDLIPRYRTMCGYYAPRRAGWDTHGLPVELEVEKELGISGKPDIERYGVDKFNEKCKESVFKYIKEWEKLTERLGIWMDLEHPYITCSNEYIETLWWVLKELWERGLLYEGHKVLPYCARCGTSLSSHEVALGYQETEDPSLYVKFALRDREKTYFLVWTTTPWTLAANVALAVGKNINYLEVVNEENGEHYILSEDSFYRLLGEDTHYKVIRKYRGEELVGIKYEPLLDFVVAEKGYEVFSADFVTTEEGTGVVHIAPAFGEDDLQLAQQEDLPLLQPVRRDGKYGEEITPWQGMWVKDADPLIIDYLEEKGKLFKKETYRHSYPFCWRCDTPLLYYAKESWFIRTTSFRDALLENNQKINWYPSHIKEGRFGDFLSNVVDWALSRERYWGTPLNIWQCKNCNFKEAIGSIEELKNRSREKIEEIELHRPYVDRITLSCPQCGGVMERVPEVVDCWFDSGAMFVAQLHFPFENEEEFQQSFPADFICEAIDQTRGWFYSLHVLATALFNSPAYRNCLVTELGLDEKGQKMSKHVGNVVDPWDLIQDYGADALRWYVFSVSPPWVPKRFGKEAIRGVLSKFFDTLWNVTNFFILYANIDGFEPPTSSFLPLEKRSVFDRWIISRLQELIKEVRDSLDHYEVSRASKAIEDFVIEDLSNWYIRRSRRRFWKAEKDEDKVSAYHTLYQVLTSLTRLLAPFIPATAELLYQTLEADARGKRESVHLEDYPLPEEESIDRELLLAMEVARKLTNLGRSVRNKVNIKLRQPLRKAIMVVPQEKERERALPFTSIIQEELNVKEIEWISHLPEEVTVSLKPRFSILGPRYGQKVKEIARLLKNLEEDKSRQFWEMGEVSLLLEGEEVILKREEVELELQAREGLAVESEGEYAVILDTFLGQELQEEGMVRDLIHAIQIWRKEAGLEVEDRIELEVREGTDPEWIDLIEKYSSLIQDEVLASSLSLCGDGEREIISKEWELNGKKLVLALRRRL